MGYSRLILSVRARIRRICFKSLVDGLKTESLAAAENFVSKNVKTFTFRIKQVK